MSWEFNIKVDLLCFLKFSVIYKLSQWWMLILNSAKPPDNEVVVSIPCEPHYLDLWQRESK